MPLHDLMLYILAIAVLAIWAVVWFHVGKATMAREIRLTVEEYETRTKGEGGV